MSQGVIRRRGGYAEAFVINEEQMVWWWVTWRLWERMSGWCATEEEAEAAMEHFHTPDLNKS